MIAVVGRWSVSFVDDDDVVIVQGQRVMTYPHGTEEETVAERAIA
jgi:hypothetical protein